MKTIATISIFLLLVSFSFSNNINNIDIATPTNTPSIYEIGSNAKLMLPWADNSPVNMVKVYSKGEYSIWKCKSQNVTRYPGKNIKGEEYNYFVYKNGKFHMTVTEMNKDSVFAFFSK